jgi:MoaA/NifB/PqqE/SkfB family radical SAM enzyme
MQKMHSYGAQAMDKYLIDSHKLMYHPEIISYWLRGFAIPPVYVEVSPSSICNQDCTFCGLDFARKGKILDRENMAVALKAMGASGVKAVMFGGEGEPLVTSNTAHLACIGYDSGVDPALTTNGVLFHGGTAEAILHYCKWVKFSINAGTAPTYKEIHRCSDRHFYTVLHNISEAAYMRKKKGYTCTIGVQMVLLPENADETHILARLVRDAGADYLVVKPYSHHPQSRTTEYRKRKVTSYAIEENTLFMEETARFKVIIRKEAFSRLEQPMNYEACYALPFWRYIDSNGDVWSCSTHIGNRDFHLGNIANGWDKLSAPSYMYEDISECRVNCRMNRVNEYLWRLKNPDAHDNFI